MFAINVNYSICYENGKDKTMFVTEDFWSRSDSLRNLSGVIWTILAYLQTLDPTSTHPTVCLHHRAANVKHHTF